MVKEPNDFYVFITNVKLGETLFVPKSSCLSMGRSLTRNIYRILTVQDEDPKNYFVSFVEIQEETPWWFEEFTLIAEEMITGALMMRGLCLSEPRFYSKNNRELKIDMERWCDDDYKKHQLISYIKFTVLKWEAPTPE